MSDDALTTYDAPDWFVEGLKIALRHAVLLKDRRDILDRFLATLERIEIAKAQMPTTGVWATDGPAIDTREGLLWRLSSFAARCQLVLALLEDDHEDARERRAFDALGIACAEISALCDERDWANKEGN